jgi:protein required for attachment to host cells
MEIHRLGPVWILVAHESGARIFSRLNPAADLELLEVIDHPIGRAKEQEMKSDRPGREEGWGPSAARYSFGKHVSATDKNAIDFAHDLAARLDKERDLNTFDRLILVAGPRFLGMLRQALPEQTAQRIVKTLDQNLGNIGDREIPKHLAPLLSELDRTAGLRQA